MYSFNSTLNKQLRKLLQDNKTLEAEKTYMFHADCSRKEAQTYILSLLNSMKEAGEPILETRVINNPDLVYENFEQLHAFLESHHDYILFFNINYHNRGSDPIFKRLIRFNLSGKDAVGVANITTVYVDGSGTKHDWIIFARVAPRVSDLQLYRLPPVPLTWGVHI